MAIWGVLMPIVMSGVIELGQAYLTVHRSGEWWDFASNTIGVFTALAGMLLYFFFLRKGKR